MPRAVLSDIRLHPIKSLEGVSVQQSRIGVGGGLEFDRAWALVAADGAWLNGKRTPEVQRIRADYAADISAVTLSAGDDRPDMTPQTFSFPDDHAAAGDWFSRFFRQPVTVRHAPEGMPDDTDRNGPVLVSTATLESLSQWFQFGDVDESRRRFRA